MSNEKTTEKKSLSVLLGAAFLMATSAIGPGFLTQTSQFTAKYLPRNKRSVSGVCQGPRYFSYNGVSLYKLRESFLGGNK